MIFNPYGPLAIQVSPGDNVPILGADAMVAGQNSVVLAPLDSGPVARKSIMFTMSSGSTGAYNVMGSNNPPTAGGPQQGVVLAALAASGAYQDTTGFAFYWVNCTGAGTASVQVRVS
jgi:hypothetical protein